MSGWVGGRGWLACGSDVYDSLKLEVDWHFGNGESYPFEIQVPIALTDSVQALW